jgi:DNA-binding NarL/FixJ family response regulator
MNDLEFIRALLRHRVDWVTSGVAESSSRSITEPATPIRVLCVDDNTDVLKALAYVLNRAPGVQCVGSLTSAKGLSGKAPGLHADVVLLDYSIPGESSLDSLREVRREHPEIGVIMFTGFDDADTIDAAIGAGAARCMPKDADIADLVDAIVSVRTATSAATGRTGA